MFGAVERGEEVVDGGFVNFLFRGDATFVDAVVDFVVGPLVCFLDLSAQVFRQEIDGGICLGQEIVESSIHHADDFTRLVVDDLFCF